MTQFKDCAQNFIKELNSFIKNNDIEKYELRRKIENLRTKNSLAERQIKVLEEKQRGVSFVDFLSKEDYEAEIKRLMTNEEFYEREMKSLKAELEMERTKLDYCEIAAAGEFSTCEEEYKSVALSEVLLLYDDWVYQTDKEEELNDQIRLLQDDLKQLREEHQRVLEDLKNEKIRLSVCGVAAEGYFEKCLPSYHSESLNKILKLQEDVNSLREENKELRSDAVLWNNTRDIYGYLCELENAVRKLSLLDDWNSPESVEHRELIRAILTFLNKRGA